MTKKGKGLEQLVAAIQEVIKDCPNTIVQTNILIPNSAGIKREIDILVSTNVQGICNCTAFECKDYSTSARNKPVDIQVVDAFIGKCSLMPAINQKVIVSATGFSKNAKIEAEKAGIKLYAFENIPIDKIIIKGDAYISQTRFKANRIECAIINNGRIETKILSSFDYELHCESKRETIQELFKRKINSMSDDDYRQLVDRFEGCNKKPFNNTYFYTPNEMQYIRLDNGISYMLVNITFNVIVDFVQTKGNKDVQKRLRQGDKNIEVIEYNFANRDFKMLIIKNEDNASFYVKNDNGLREIGENPRVI